MKKLLLLAVLSLSLFSCSSDDSQQEQTPIITAAKDDTGNPNVPQAPTEAQKKEAESKATYAVELAEQNETLSKARICGTPNYNTSSGSVYVEVTLADGSVHYAHTSWIRVGGEFIVKSIYQGTGSLPYYGC